MKKLPRYSTKKNKSVFAHRKDNACWCLYRYSTMKAADRIALKYKGCQLFIDMCGKTCNNGKLSKCCFPMRGRSDFFPFSCAFIFKISLYSVSVTGIHCGGSKVTHVAELERAVSSISVTLDNSSQK